MSLKDAYQARVEAEIKGWEADYSKWKAKAEIAGADAQIEYYKKLEGIQARLEKAKKCFGELKSSTEEAWEELKPGIDKAGSELNVAFNELRESLERALGKFQHK
ncbi:MAG: hypothetical protein K2W82_10170 [Candidatus Obscuribacterales bacterium]|nr:hypothetical protein [Candidatus Obscuribacterales bacterium]